MLHLANCCSKTIHGYCGSRRLKCQRAASAPAPSSCGLADAHRPAKVQGLSKLRENQDSNCWGASFLYVYDFAGPT
uniref:Uncharacterized protein n=1 Tax=Arundo donax TaxID=35708 RepID=A0A0A9B8Y6_ARUDO